MLASAGEPERGQRETLVSEKSSQAAVVKSVFKMHFKRTSSVWLNPIQHDGKGIELLWDRTVVTANTFGCGNNLWGQE